MPDTNTQTRLPRWWLTDPEHAPAVKAFTFLRATRFMRDDPELGWMIDFEDAWQNGPCSSGERILIALAWSLYNLNMAAEQEAIDHAAERVGPLYLSNPSHAVGVLGEEYWATYCAMVALARPVR